MHRENRHNAPVAGFIGLGSNLGDGPKRLRNAVADIDRLPATRVGLRSSLYESIPMGAVSQPLFTNAVVQIETRLPPPALLAELQRLERSQGRARTLHWGPRTLDLDILVHGAIASDVPGLQIPHPGIPERAFVLYPLGEIAPTLDIPGMGTPVELLRGCPGPAPRRLRHRL